MYHQLLFVLAVVLFLIHQFLQKILNVPIPVVDNYLDPLLMMPILLTCVDWERRVLFKKPSLSIFEIILWTMVISVMTEYFFPRWSHRFTQDGKDVLCYLTGSACYFLSKQMAPSKGNKTGSKRK